MRLLHRNVAPRREAVERSTSEKVPSNDKITLSRKVEPNLGSAMRIIIDKFDRKITIVIAAVLHMVARLLYDRVVFPAA